MALRIAKDPRIERLICTHKGTYADDCLVQRVQEHKCYIVATNDKDLRRRIRKIPGVPIMYVQQKRYSIERMPDAFGAPRTWMLGNTFWFFYLWVTFLNLLLLAENRNLTCSKTWVVKFLLLVFNFVCCEKLSGILPRVVACARCAHGIDMSTESWFVVLGPNFLPFQPKHNYQNKRVPDSIFRSFQLYFSLWTVFIFISLCQFVMTRGRSHT